jgi:hypothetical protein
MADEIEAYQGVSVALRQHETAVNQALNLIRGLVSAAANGRWISIAVTGVEMPAPLMSRDAHYFNPQSWPTGESITQMLVMWHKLNSEKQNAWRRIPSERREGLTPPRPI